jgi:hypothetical protein
VFPSSNSKARGAELCCISSFRMPWCIANPPQRSINDTDLTTSQPADPIPHPLSRALTASAYARYLTEPISPSGNLVSPSHHHITSHYGHRLLR